ncbi:glycosyltransferase [Actinoplanes awajinensis]|uniref:Glycosyl transferase family 1 n=1 Tax=Actinoplanes awajinensis subsp. mycoplanecinus TaxID=135947 RepID=A0A0X3UPF4_9ACTN|nr:glycosyltransferase [Actinoplanes awajinensis]KUL34469.1 glycosyl transferase family 1 [Actinoplanes awajinensis subsp. mycoplanecinus]
MKVVVAHNRYREAIPSGENVIVDTEIEQLRAAGLSVVPFQRSSDSIEGMSVAQKALLPVSPMLGVTAQRDLAALIETERPDVLHLHNPYPLLSPRVIRTAHRYQIPVVQTVHNYRQVCSSGLYFRDGHNCHDCRGKVLGWPAITNKCYRGSAAQSAIMATTLAVHRPTWRSVERYIALTDKIAAHLISYGIPAERIVIKPNGLPDPGQPEPLGDGFLYGARLSAEKGLGLLLDAWRQHPDGSLGPLRIAGDGELRHLAEQAAADRSDVTYLGPLDRAGMTAARQAAAVVVAVPTWEDVLPTVILEAMASGRPVLGTAVGGVPYLIGDGPEAAGWLAAPEVSALAAALPVARAGAMAMAVGARERYLRHFHPDVLTKRLIDIYAGMAAART